MTEAKPIEQVCFDKRIPSLDPASALRGKMEGTLTDPRVMAAIIFVIMGVLYAILH